MDTCALCLTTGCDCALTKTVEFVRALIQKELDHLSGARESLLRRTEQLDEGQTRDEVDRLNGLIHRLWVRILAVEDFGESFDHAISRALHSRRAEMTMEQGVRRAQDSPR